MVKYIFLILFLFTSQFASAQTYIQNQNLVEVPNVTATAAGTTTLAYGAATNQVFTGTTTQTAVLPSALSLQVGRRFYVSNESTGTVTLNYNGGTTAATLLSGQNATLRLLNNGTSAGTWDVALSSSGSGLASIAAYSVLANNSSLSAVPSAQQSLTLGTPAITDTGVAFQTTGSVAGYFQHILQNTSNNTAASSDFIVNNNLGTASTYFGDFGINSSTFTGSGSLNLPSATYLYSNSGDLVLGTGTSNSLHFLTNSATTDAMTINSSGGIITPALTGYIYANGSSAVTASTTIPASALSGQASVANGGTGLATLGAHGALVGEGTGSVVSVTPGASGTVLTSTGASSDPTWQTAGTTSPLTTKGDSYTYSTVNARQAVPGDYGRLIPDSTKATGWRSAGYANHQQGRPGKNYIQYADFENGATTGWTLGTVGTLTNGLPTGSPTFGSGADANLSISTVSSSQLAGSYSLSYSEAASHVTVAGNMVASSSYAIDAADQAKVLTVKFYYSVPSGASQMNFSGTSSNSMAWALWDVTNSVWLSSAGNFCTTQSTGVGYCTGTAQTGSSTANISLVLYNANATTVSTVASTIYLDDFYLGPQTAPSGPAMTDWVAYTPTIVGFGTPTNVSFFSRRDGGDLLVQGGFSSGTSTATTAQIGLGFNGASGNVTADSTKLDTSTNTSIGSVAFGSTSTGIFTVIAPTSNQTYVNLGLQNGSTAGTLPGQGNAIAGSGTAMTFSFRVPIVGWSSNSSMSSDTDTRVVAAVITQTAPYAMTAGAAIAMATPTIYDSHGAYNSVTGQYIIPVTGVYQFSISGRPTVSSVMWLNKGGSAFVNMGAFATGNASNPPVTTTVNCNAGDVITFVADTSTTLNYSAYSGTTTGYKAVITINRLSGPAVVTADASVNARYTFTNGGSSIPNGTQTTLTSSYATYTKIRDSHGLFNSATGVYTIPLSGMYRATLRTSITNTTASTGGVYAYITQAGSQSLVAETVTPFAAIVGATAVATDTFNCLPGDTLTLAIQQNNGAAISISGGAPYNSFSIERVGN